MDLFDWKKPVEEAVKKSSTDLTWSKWGSTFFTPYLDRHEAMIAVCDYLYDWHPDGEGEVVTVMAERVFEFNTNAPHIGSIGGCNFRYIPATKDNLLRLSQLPFVSDDDRVEALQEYMLFEHIMPQVCGIAIALKSGAVLDGEGPHRAPAFQKTVEITRQPTQQEALAMAFGAEVDLTEKKTVVEIHAECQEFQKYGGKYKLYSQQLIAAWSIVQCKRMALWMDMRTGKTASAFAAAQYLMDHGIIDRVLVICPVTNMYDPWGPELDDAGFITHILDGSKDEDYEAIHEDSMVNAFIINYERVHDRMWEMFEAWDWKRTMIIADETSAVKNPNSNRTRAFHAVTRRAEYVALLNGTPMEQGPHDVWSQLLGVDRYGAQFGRTFSRFADLWLDQISPGKWHVKKELRMAFEIELSLYGIRYIRAEADQFLGKDKQFRHVPLKPTEEMLKQMIRINDGYLSSFDENGQPIVENMTDCLLRTYGFLREVCCAYDKFRTEEDGPYKRRRHKIDPKTLWVQTFIAAQPGTPLIIFCEFNEQEQRLKEMLTDMGVPFSGTRPMMKVVEDQVLSESVPRDLWNEIKRQFHDDPMVESVMDWGTGDLFLPEGIRYRADIVRFVAGILDYKSFRWKRLKEKMEKAQALADRPGTPEEGETAKRLVDSLHVKMIEEAKKGCGGQKYAANLLTFKRYLDRGPYPAAERKNQIDDFNTGKTHVFIMKWAQGRGMSLHRKPAVADGIGTWPAIISMAPPWSLGSWDQGQDRAVVTDPATGRNVCTMIYNLTIKGSFEDKKIMKALREKKQIQAALLQDNQREGYSNFVSNLIEDMKEAMLSGDGYFDATEMQARIDLGVPPYSKLTESLVLNKAKSKFNCKSKADAMAHIDQDEDLRRSFLYLKGKFQ